MKLSDINDNQTSNYTVNLDLVVSLRNDAIRAELYIKPVRLSPIPPLSVLSPSTN